MTIDCRAIVIFGPPTSGKGTQGKILGAVPGFLYFGSGDTLRSLSSQGHEVRHYLQAGELIPDKLMIDIWKGVLQRQIAEGTFDPKVELLVLDGLPRNVKQAKAVAAEANVERVLHLTGDEAMLMRRIQKRSLQQGRKDDACEEVIRRRFQAYHEQTAPLLNHYGFRQVSEIAADQPPLGVLQQVVASVRPLEPGR